jgi:hypothetical protein
MENICVTCHCEKAKTICYPVVINIHSRDEVPMYRGCNSPGCRESLSFTVPVGFKLKLEDTILVNKS